MALVKRYEQAFHIKSNTFTSQFMSYVSFSFFLYAFSRAAIRLTPFSFPGQCADALIPILHPIVAYNDVCTPYITWVTARVAVWNSAHIWAWLIIGFLGIFASLYPKQGKLNVEGVRGLCIAGFAVCYHELIWYVGYFSIHANLLHVLIEYTYWIWVAMLSLCLVAFWLIGYHKDLNIKVLILASIPWYIYITAWVTIGFPTTMDFYDKTVWYDSGIGDIVELSSWLLMSSSVLASYIYKNK